MLRGGSRAHLTFTILLMRYRCYDWCLSLLGYTLLIQCPTPWGFRVHRFIGGCYLQLGFLSVDLMRDPPAEWLIEDLEQELVDTQDRAADGLQLAHALAALQAWVKAGEWRTISYENPGVWQAHDFTARSVLRATGDDPVELAYLLQAPHG